MSRFDDEQYLIAELKNCTNDEIRVLVVRMQRMAAARPRYGGLDLATDRRDFRREMAEEGVDRGFYEDCLYIARQDMRLKNALTGDCTCRAGVVECALHAEDE